jgi:DNA-binding XRE family transcriptional regulator
VSAPRKPRDKGATVPYNRAWLELDDGKRVELGAPTMAKTHPLLRRVEQLQRDAVTIGARLRAARERAGLTLAQVGERCGLARQHVHRYEAGEQEPGAAALRALCVALEVSADLVLGLTPATRAKPAGRTRRKAGPAGR